MRQMTCAQVVHETLTEELGRDPSVIVLGEDIRFGASFGGFEGLVDVFGTDRIIDMPISESVIMASALGAAVTGLRPVAYLGFADFLPGCMDELVNQTAKMRYMFGGQARVPLVVMAQDGIVHSAAAHHSQSLEAWFVHVPGLKVVTPASGADCKGLLKSAIRDDNPVVFLVHKGIWGKRWPLPDAGPEHIVPLGKAEVVRKGTDVTIVAYSVMVSRSLEAAEILAGEGISTEVVDLRTLAPLDWPTVVESVRKTSRVVIAHEAGKTGGVGAEIGCRLSEELFDQLNAPIRRVASADVPVPFSPVLERQVYPQTDAVVAAVRDTCTGG